MSPMDHAEARERIGDLALEPARLAALAADASPADRDLLEHLTACRECAAELEGWQRVRLGVAAAMGDEDAPSAMDAIEPIRPPEALRSAVLAIAADDGRPVMPETGARATIRAGLRRSFGSRLAGRTPGRPSIAWAGLAAALIVALVAGSTAVQQAARVQTAEASAADLNRVTVALDRVLADPGHRVVTLVRPDGTAGGSVSWTSHDLVVLTTALQPPAAGAVYRCWLSEGDEGWAIGRMDFSGDAAYWVGSTDAWASFQIGPGSTFRVSLEPPGADPKVLTGPVVLEASLGS